MRVRCKFCSFTYIDTELGSIGKAKGWQLIDLSDEIRSLELNLENYFLVKRYYYFVGEIGVLRY